MKAKITLIVSILCIAIYLNAETANPQKVNSDDVLKVLGFSSWKYEVENKNNNDEIGYELIYYSRDKDGKWTSTVLDSLTISSVQPPKKFSIGLYQKDNEITIILGDITRKLDTKKKYNIDLSDLSTSFGTAILDTIRPVILRIKPKSNRIIADPKEWDKYLALKIQLK